MEVVAQTNGAFLIQATETEIKEIISAVTGSKPEKVLIGQKLPAIDYAGTITKIKTLRKQYNYQQLLEQLKRVQDEVSSFSAVVEQAATIDQDI